MPDVLIVVSEFNQGITEGLLKGALGVLEREGNVRHSLVRVPGAFELPVVAGVAARSGHFSAVICLGAVIRGETAHFDFVAGEAASGLMQLAIETGVPISFGVLTTDNVQQAMARSGQDENNKGAECAHAALMTMKAIAQLRAETASGRNEVSSGG